VIVFWGKRARGWVHGCENAYVETDFFCVNFVPLVPLGSFLVLFDDNGNARRVPLRAVTLSLVAAYVRGWAAVPAVACLAAAFIALVGRGDNAFAVMWILVGLPFAAVAWLGRYIGRLSTEGLALREAYERATGFPVDVALLPLTDGQRLRVTLHARIAAETEALASKDYRTAVDSKKAYLAAALEPFASDDYVHAALALARLDWCAATPEEKSALAASHEAIHARVRSRRASSAST
jgi:hypothetical protein